METPAQQEAYDAGCPFCRIAAGVDPARLVFEGERTIAFLDRRPLFPGHVLVAPRRHFETLGDLPSGELIALMEVVQAAARAMESAVEAQGSFVAVNNRVSQSVPHVHVHVVPRRRGDGLRGFFWPRGTYANDDEASAWAEVVRRGIAAELEAAPR